MIGLSHVARVGIAAVLVSVIGFGVLKKIREESLEGIQETAASDYPLRFRDVLTGQRSLDPARWRELIGKSDEYLDIGSNKLQWSVAAEKSGYLYFGSTWEFALCDRKTLPEVERSDLDRPFCGAGDPRGPLEFEARWFTNSIMVHEGEIVLARLVKETNCIFAIHMYEQKGMVGAQTRIRFKPVLPLNEVENP